MTSTAAKPNVLPVNTDGIPDELRPLTQWVVWRNELRTDSKGNEKWTKVPYDAKGSRKGKADDPGTWSNLSVALSRYERGGFDGIGFEFADDDPYVGIDLDKCRDAESGELTKEAAAIIAKLKSYSEVSPSATGVKVWVKGSLPTGKTGSRTGALPGLGDVEMYHRGRFFCVTGQRLEETPAAIHENQPNIDECWSMTKAGRTEKKKTQTTSTKSGPPKTTSVHQTNGRYIPSDAEVIAKCYNCDSGAKFTRLWNGHWEGTYESQSQADAALCNYIAFWTGPDHAVIERIFRQSGLMRDKWERSDYRADTIDLALSGRSADDFFKWSQPSENGSSEESKLRFTDVGNAKRLALWHGQDYHYCYQWGKFQCWDGKRWKNDDTGAMERAAKDTARRLWKLAANEQDESKRKELAKHAAHSEKAERQSAMIRLSRSEPGIPVMPDQFDADPWSLNTPSGTVNLRTGQLRPHRREDLLTRITRAEYLPANECECPLWEKTVEGILAGKPELIRYVRRLIGYSLIGVVSDAILPIFWGGGSNGKSLFVETLLYVIGPDYADTIQPDLLLASYGDRHPTERADLFGKRLVAAVETDENRRLSESAVKALTGGDTIKARRMREDFWSFRPSHTVVLISNHKPVVRGNDHGLWRRLRLIPFTVRFWNRRKGETGPPELEADEDLGEKLKDEAAGILRWCVDGALDWQRTKLADPDEVRAATAEYRRDSDALGEFLSVQCWVEGRFADEQGSDDQYPLEKYPLEIPPDGLYEKSGMLFTKYKMWCARRCEEPITANRFGRYLGERGFRREKVGTIRWYGLKLKESVTGDDPEDHE